MSRRKTKKRFIDLALAGRRLQDFFLNRHRTCLIGIVEFKKISRARLVIIFGPNPDPDLDQACFQKSMKTHNFTFICGLISLYPFQKIKHIIVQIFKALNAT